jgi:Fungal hydrophobin.
MQFSQIISIALFAAVGVVAHGDFNPCPGSLYSVASCCDLNVDSILGLTCDEAHEAAGSAGEFAEICAAHGQGAQCCALPVVSYFVA